MLQAESGKKSFQVWLTVCVLCVSACARHEEQAIRTGSLKDDYGDYRASLSRREQFSATPREIVEAKARVLTPLPSAAPSPAPAPPPIATAPVVPSAVAPPRSSSAAVAAPQAIAPPAPKGETAPSRSDDPSTVTTLLAEGQALFEAGKVVQARRRFIAAMNGPIPDVLLALARTYDTYYLSRLPASDATPDMQRALVLYERAAQRGAPGATTDLERTRGFLNVPQR